MLTSLVFLASAQAATFTVDSSAWLPDQSLSGPTCSTTAGTCTLRAALEQARSLGGTSEIVLPAGTFPIDGIVELWPGRDLTVRGAGAGATVLVQKGTAVFDLIDMTLRLQDLTLDGSQATVTTPMIDGAYEKTTSIFGGAVLSTTAAVTLTDVEVLDAPGTVVRLVDASTLDGVGTLSVTMNRVTSVGGAGDLLDLGGDYYHLANATLQDVVLDTPVGGDLVQARYASVTVDRFQVLGGAIDILGRATDGNVTLRNGLVDQVAANRLFGEARGPSTDAGYVVLDRVRVQDSTSASCAGYSDAWATVSLRNSQVIRNTSGGSLICGGTNTWGTVFAFNYANGNGGVIQSNGWYAYGVQLRDSVLFRNRATGSGGGVWSDGTSGKTPIDIRHVTFFGNVADNDDTGGATGGNAWLRGAAVRGSAFVNGRVGNAPDDLDATFTAAADNFVSAEASSGLSGLIDGVSGNQVGSIAAPLDALLTGPKKLDNGTFGLVPKAGSPLIDASDAWTSTDLGGTPRPVDGDGDGTARADIGAVERH